MRCTLTKEKQYSWLLDLSEVDPGKKLVPLPDDSHRDGQWAAVANAQGTLLLTAGFDGKAIIWRPSVDDNKKWQPETLLFGASPSDKNAAIYAAALAADDRDLVLGTFGGKIRRWHDEGGGFVEQDLLLDAEDPIRTLAYSRDGTRLVAGDESGLLRIWRIAEGRYQRERSVSAHKGTIYSARFTDDGRLLTGGSDGRGYLWSKVNGSFDRKRRLGLEGPRAEVVSVAFESDGNLVAASDADGYVHLWTLGMPGLVKQACAVLGRNLSKKEWDRYLGKADYECTCPNLPPTPDVKGAVVDGETGCAALTKAE